MNDLGLNLNSFQANAELQSAPEVADLTKAMSAGYTTGRLATDIATPGVSGGLIAESVENLMRVLTFKRKNIVLWNYIPKGDVATTVHEYQTLVSYGSGANSGFVAEGALPEEDDTTFERKSKFVKFMGEVRKVTHVATLTKLVPDMSLIRQETESGILSLLQRANRALPYGDSSVYSLAWDGLYKQHQDSFVSLDAWQDSDLVVDLRGKILRQDDVETGALGAQIGGNYAFIDTLFAPPEVISDLGKDYYSKQRIMLNAGSLADMKTGGTVKVITTTSGDVELMKDVFLSNRTLFKTAASPSVGAQAPAAPTADPTTPAAVVTDASTRFAGFAGDYDYYVSSVNNFGESALTELTTGFSVAATESVNLKFTVSNNSYPATGFNIYRSEAGNPDGKLYKILTVTTAQLAAGFDGGAAGLIRDRNRFIAGTEEAFALENTSEVWSFVKLSDFMKMDLARLDISYRFAVLMYGAPILYMPKKMVRFINIGKDFTV